MREDITKYLSFILKNIWIVILSSGLLGGMVYLYFSSQDTNYSAQAKIFIGNALQPNTDLGEVDLGLRIAPTYAEFATTYNVMMNTIETLNLDLSVDQLRHKITTRIVVDTAILIIQVHDSGAEQAAVIANELARNLILESPSYLSEAEREQLQIQSDLISELQAQLAITQEQSLQVLEDINKATERGDQTEIDKLTDQYNRLVDQLNSSRSTIAQLSDTFVGLSRRANNLVFFEEARTPKSPTGLNPKLVGIVSAMAGAGFAISGLLLYLEFIDTKLYTENDIKQSLDLPVVSRIAKFRGVRRNLAKLAQPNYLAQHPFAESYRIAQTNLLLGNQNDEVRPIFLIASPQHNDGRTFTTINLAIIAAESGLNTLLIDADFRSPTLDRLFDVDNSQGFATLLGNWTDTRLTSSTFKDYIHETNFSRLYILPSGVDEVSLSSQILTFTNSDKLISQINQAFKYDVIFIDMPPSMRFADSYKLAGVLKADVILVSHKGNTNREDALRVKEQFGVVGCKVKGVIINEA